MKQSKDLLQALQAILLKEQMQTHEEIAKVLNHQGYHVNQSTISRLLRKLGAIKGLNAQSRLVYLLPKEAAAQASPLALHKLIRHIVYNEQLIVIHTTPASANVIAHQLDLHQKQCHILGTIAGDDTLLIIPTSTAKLNQTLEATNKLIYEHTEK